MICLLIFISGNSALHGLIPGSNKFTSKFLQNRVCPLSMSESIRKGKDDCFPFLIARHFECGSFRHFECGSFFRLMTVNI